MPRGGDTTCQRALFDASLVSAYPRSFMLGVAADLNRTAIPFVGPDQRLRRDLQKRDDTLDSQRRERSFTFPQLAQELNCTHGQLSEIKRARFAIGMRLAMRIVTWLDRPARDFVSAAKW